MENEGGTVRPFCAKCGRLITKIPLKSSKTARQYCSVVCQHLGDAQGDEDMVRAPVECACGERFPTSADLIKHKQEGLCKAFNEDEEVNKAIEKESLKVGDMRKKFECVRVLYNGEICGASFGTERERFEHDKIAHPLAKRMAWCPKCNKPYLHLKRLRTHLEDEHDMDVEEIEAIVRPMEGQRVVSAMKDAVKTMVPIAIGMVESIVSKEPVANPKPSIVEPPPVFETMRPVGGLMEEFRQLTEMRDRAEDMQAKLSTALQAELAMKGMVCSQCGIEWAAKGEPPQHCPKCGTKLFTVMRRHIRF